MVWNRFFLCNTFLRLQSTIDTKNSGLNTFGNYWIFLETVPQELSEFKEVQPHIWPHTLLKYNWISTPTDRLIILSPWRSDHFEQIRNWLSVKEFARQNQLQRWLCLVVVTLLNLSERNGKERLKSWSRDWVIFNTSRVIFNKHLKLVVWS